MTPYRPFDYLHFAKTDMAGAKHVLCLSGVDTVPPTSFLPADVLAASHDATDLAAPRRKWQEAMSARYGVPAGECWPALGSSGATHMALMALLSFDTDASPVAAEEPQYRIFDTTSTLLGRDVIPVPRLADHGYAVDLDAADQAFRRGASVLCVTNLHNPTGAALRGSDLAALDGMAARHGAWVLVDDIFRDFLPGPVATSRRPGSRIVATGSFTKCYGVGPVRAGWIIAPPEVIRRVESIEETACGVPSAQWMTVLAEVPSRVQPLLDRSRSTAAARLPVVERWIEETRGVSWMRPAAGITGLLRIEGLRDSIRFARELRAELGVQVVPGAYFGAEGAVRISFGTPEADLRAALDTLALGIGALARA
ncbi:MAG: Histidinol-phosphate aminotransferase [Planctomycetes bacterium]|nr:Histidinol-phosphate aminotransferase [Planctomycetota bacterium]